MLRSLTHQPRRSHLLFPVRSSYASLAQGFSSTRTLPADIPEIRKADNKNPSVERPHPGKRDQLSFFPFALIFAIGTGLYVFIVRSREGKAPRPADGTTVKGELPFKRNRNKAQQQDYDQD